MISKNRSKVKKYIEDVEPRADARNTRYRSDARYTNFTGRTKNGLIGAVFRREPTVDLPKSVEYLKGDATGNKLSLTKLAQEAVGEVLQAGRYGLLVDYPASQEGLTVEQVSELNLAARIYKYKAESIINWHCELINGQYQLTLVVLQETQLTMREDGFTWEELTCYRVLKIKDGKYVQQLWNEHDEIVNEYLPRDFHGNTWDYIPFVFVGAEDNDTIVDPAPLYDLAELNIGHLRNSADYEESVHITGQPTLFMTTDMSAQAWKDLNPNGILIGSRKGHNLGTSGSATMLQPDPNQLADVVMQRKEEQAVMIGARLILPASNNETAEKARLQHAGENSVLSIIAGNVEDAINQCIEWAIVFMSANPEAETEQVVFELNDQFFDLTIDPQLIMAQIQLFNNGMIAKADMRKYLRKVGTIEPGRTDEDIDEEVEDIDPLAGNTTEPFQE